MHHLHPWPTSGTDDGDDNNDGYDDNDDDVNDDEVTYVDDYGSLILK